MRRVTGGLATQLLAGSAETTREALSELHACCDPPSFRPPWGVGRCAAGGVAAMCYVMVEPIKLLPIMYYVMVEPLKLLPIMICVMVEPFKLLPIM